MGQRYSFCECPFYALYVISIALHYTNINFSQFHAIHLRITLLLQCFLTVGPPTITYITDPLLTVEGNKISLTCNATNDEDAVESLQIVWYNEGLVPITGQQDVIEIGTTNKLQSTISFDSISHNHDGEYTCQAFNHPQLYTEAVTSLTVECKDTKLRM